MGQGEFLGGLGRIRSFRPYLYRFAFTWARVGILPDGMFEKRWCQEVYNASAGRNNEKHVPILQLFLLICLDCVHVHSMVALNCLKLSIQPRTLSKQSIKTSSHHIHCVRSNTTKTTIDHRRQNFNSIPWNRQVLLDITKTPMTTFVIQQLSTRFLQCSIAQLQQRRDDFHPCISMPALPLQKVMTTWVRFCQSQLCFRCHINQVSNHRYLRLVWLICWYILLAASTFSRKHQLFNSECFTTLLYIPHDYGNVVLLESGSSNWFENPSWLRRCHPFPQPYATCYLPRSADHWHVESIQ